MTTSEHYLPSMSLAILTAISLLGLAVVPDVMFALSAAGFGLMGFAFLPDTNEPTAAAPRSDRPAPRRRVKIEVAGMLCLTSSVVSYMVS